VRLGEASHARRELTAAQLAPGNAATLEALTDPVRRPPAPTEPISPDVMRFVPAAALQLDRDAFLNNQRSASRGVGGGMSGTKNEHLTVCLELEETAELLADAAQHLARAEVPGAVAEALRLARLTALTKKAGGVRGIATGEVMRRLVARTLAQQFAKQFDAATLPYQFALNTRAGTDCLGLFLRALTDLDPDLVIVSLDGIGAYDHIKRSEMLRKLHTLPRANAALPFVRLFYGTASKYTWYDDDGTAHAVRQGEGGEQGDPLMPALRPRTTRRTSRSSTTTPRRRPPLRLLRRCLHPHN
jgi:hypothetical protein